MIRIEARVTYEFRFDDEIRALVVTASGEATMMGFKAYIADVLAHPRWTPGTNLLVDFRQLDTRNLSSQDIQELAEIHIANDQRIGQGALAIVMGQAASFGLARMWEAYTDGRLALHTRVFHTLEEGLAWMREVSGRFAGQEDAPPRGKSVA